MNVENELRKRFAKVIRETFKPPILVGEKWLRKSTSGQQGQYQFVGTDKVAKATGIYKHRVAKKLIERIRVRDLGLALRITPSQMITVVPIKGGGKKKTQKSTPAGAKAGRPAAKKTQARAKRQAPPKKKA